MCIQRPETIYVVSKVIGGEQDWTWQCGGAEENVDHADDIEDDNGNLNDYF